MSIINKTYVKCDVCEKQEEQPVDESNWFCLNEPLKDKERKLIDLCSKECLFIFATKLNNKYNPNLPVSPPGGSGTTEWKKYFKECILKDPLNMDKYLVQDWKSMFKLDFDKFLEELDNI